MKVSVIIPCKNRLKHLKTIFKYVLRQSYRDLDIIVVDYNCPQGTADHILQNYKDERIQVSKADVEVHEWNLSASRNHGYKFSKGEILLFIDADTMLNQKFVFDSVKRMKEGVFLSGSHRETKWHSSGCCMVWKKDFEKVKGYNEVVEGWGSEDLDFYDRLEKVGLKNEYFNFSYIRNIPHDNSVRNQYYGNKNIYETNHINSLKVKQEFRGI